MLRYRNRVLEIREPATVSATLDVVICSAKESIDVLCKAARGAGFPVASATFAAAAAVRLQCRDFAPGGLADGFALMLDAIDAGPGRVVPVQRAAGVAVDGGSVIDVGPCALDLLICETGCRSVTMTGVAGGALLVGMALVDLDRLPPLSMATDDSGSTLTVERQGDATAASISLAGEVVSWAALSDPSPGAIEVADRLWARASDLAHLTYVPSSDVSRLRGAGAGLTDND